MNSRALPRLAVAFLVLLGWVGVTGMAAAKEIKLDAQLVWGTNDDKAPNPDQKPVSADVEKRLKALPFKWQHYYEMKRRQITVAHQATQRVSMSRDCVIEVKFLEGDQVEVTLFGKGEFLGRIKQKLPPGETLVLGGNAPNFTGWFVVLRLVP